MVVWYAQLIKSGGCTNTQYAFVVSMKAYQRVLLVVAYCRLLTLNLGDGSTWLARPLSGQWCSGLPDTLEPHVLCRSNARSNAKFLCGHESEQRVSVKAVMKLSLCA